MNIKIGVPLALTLVALCGCDPRSLGFRREMRAKSSETGLALGYLGGSLMNVIPVDGGLPLVTENLENYSGPCRGCAGWFSADGRLIIWMSAWAKPNEHQEPALLVQTISGETTATWIGSLYDVTALSLSPDKSKVAVEDQRYDREEPNHGLQYVTLGTDRRVLIEPQPAQSEAGRSFGVGWSPDSRKIVFSRRGKIITVDINSGERNEIAKGTSPAWSPDGHWISFNSPKQHPMLVNPSNLEQVALWGGRTITGPIAWSPDSCCLSFSDEGRDLETLYQGTGRMIVYRVSDGRWFPAMHFGYLGGYSNNFGWFYDYRRFLEVNKANEAKWDPATSQRK